MRYKKYKKSEQFSRNMIRNIGLSINILDANSKYEIRSIYYKEAS